MQFYLLYPNPTLILFIYIFITQLDQFAEVHQIVLLKTFEIKSIIKFNDLIFIFTHSLVKLFFAILPILID